MTELSGLSRSSADNLEVQKTAVVKVLLHENRRSFYTMLPNISRSRNRLEECRHDANVSLGEYYRSIIEIGNVFEKYCGLNHTTSSLLRQTGFEEKILFGNLTFKIGDHTPVDRVRSPLQDNRDEKGTRRLRRTHTPALKAFGIPASGISAVRVSRPKSTKDTLPERSETHRR
ncbi:hypothetical protein SISNIDRAFT_469997 [Sistotremastrum niveocremeum HHB9708]|uniref:Uncharacterized protein n=1 Tax=Sistotremastrum niveocremeum HHB9708 TaxID=1314777 RepID=A0A164PHP2_9AGAM|nr:hypothetical protein SISNIDRAFT_469997 [Sistotremastrum niveocremeum HHB9708]